MELLPGHVYFIKDAFFEFVQDPYLMRNYPTTMRPHYYALKGWTYRIVLDDTVQLKSGKI